MAGFAFASFRVAYICRSEKVWQLKNLYISAFIIRCFATLSMTNFFCHSEARRPKNLAPMAF